jgi:hypothetical protein
MVFHSRRAGSAGASRPATQLWPATSVESLPLPLAAALFIPCELSFLAKADFEED